MKIKISVFGGLFLLAINYCAGQTNPLWKEEKVKNFLPHMTVPEVRELLTKTDMVIIPIGALEQHGLHLPIGTDYLNGVERAKLIAQRANVLVAPVLMAGQSPYHMGFPGTITLPSDLIVAVNFEAVKSLLHHGFKRFLILNAHGGNRALSTFLVDKINQETSGIAVELGAAIGPFRKTTVNKTESPEKGDKIFDRHGGINETASSLFLIPNLVAMDNAEIATLRHSSHIQKMIQASLQGDQTALLVLLAEGLKAQETGKGTSAAEMSTTGVWGVGDLSKASAAQGEKGTLNFVEAAVQFINRWEDLRPSHLKEQP
ncbi:creatininase family protein [Arenibacter sp. GZD96]|uniref:creatininase family protein n=1 Tax=Aurantibrevibacter litoralis TaxID=3106030 RepID=UPI002AFEABAE|nr:creatininase family protein [Arenibacter sp. GZD-96]MEA1784850.1 creatininase family protein [Arenibacter sp. GZD-96]